MEYAMRRVLAATAMLGMAASAHAADLPDFLRGSFTSAPPIVNWQGFYVGGQASTGTSDMNFSGAARTVAASLLVDSSLDQGGAVSSLPVGGRVSVHGSGFGGFVGYNSQWADVVLGVEFSDVYGKFGGSQTGQISRSFTDPAGFLDNVTYQASSSIAISDVGTFRARAGYAVGAFLPYAFGGLALGQANIFNSAHIFGTQDNANLTPPQHIQFDLSGSDGRFNRLIYGYTAGLGVDVMLTAGLFLRAEWEYVRFTTQVDTNVNTVRAGLGYKF
jgi:outer membrane immunogenic protein